MEEKKKRTGNVSTTSEVELQPKTRDRKASRNSWADIYNETTALRKHKRLLGQEINTDDSLEWRVQWGQRGAGVSCLLATICFFAGQHNALAVFGAIILTFFGMLYYKNVSIVIAKRLLQEMNVVIILVLGLCNLIVDIAQPTHALSPVIGFFFMLTVCAFVFLDAVKGKSRAFVIVLEIIFVSVNIYGICNYIFGDWDQGVVLFKYTIQGNEYTFMKRSFKRSIFLQVMLFSMDGIYTLFEDRKQELMIFATGHIYRETGTASKEVKDKQYSEMIKSEKSISV